jgi:peptidoglycan/LPS O-acetylase OafA/YrhL
LLLSHSHDHGALFAANNEESMTGIASVREKDFRPDVEGLRGVAILCVILYHVGWSVAMGGYIGVDMFFVLSGYLITGLLVTEAENKGRIDFIRFFARRIRRLVPAAALVLLAVLVICWVVYSPVERVDFAKSGIATALYLSNVRYAGAATNYLRLGTNKLDPLLHTWSLGVEEQFYLIWPFLVALVLLAGVKRFGGQRRRLLFFVMLVLACGSLALSIWLIPRSPAWAFFGLPSRGWQFAAGGLAVIVQRRTAPIWGWLSLGAVIVAINQFSESTRYPGVAAIVPTLATIGLLLSGVGDASRGVSRYLASPMLRLIGRVSYSWYLWHWPFIVIGAAFLPRGGIAFRVACALTALLLAAATYKLVENPIRRSPTLSARPLLAVAMGAVLVSGAAVAAFGFWRAAVVAESAPGQRPYAKAHRDFATIDHSGCLLIHFSTEQPPCVFGSKNAKSTIVLFGDSHAGHWFPALEEAATRRGLRLVVRVRAECPAVSVTVYSRILRRLYPECDTWRDGTIREIIGMHPSLVFIGSSRRYAFRTAARRGARSGVSEDEWLAGARTTLRKFQEAGIPVSVIRDVPAPAFDMSVCLSRAAWSRIWNRASCNYRDTVVSPPTRAETTAAQEFSGSGILDLNGVICPARECNPEIGKLVTFRDGSHITASFSRSLAPYFEANIDSRLARPAPK